MIFKCSLCIKGRLVQIWQRTRARYEKERTSDKMDGGTRTTRRVTQALRRINENGETDNEMSDETSGCQRAG